MFKDVAKNEPGSEIGASQRRAVLNGCLGLSVTGLLWPSLAFGSEQSKPAVIQPGSSEWAARGRIRRVVTGLNRDGKSCVIADEVVGANDVWNTTQEQPFGPRSAEEPPREVHPTGATRLFLAALPPSRDPKPSLSNRIGFRPTQGIAYCLILNGEIQLLTDVQEVTLKAGDVLVERMAAHSWRNEGSFPVGMLIVRIEA
jgi:hypothetical protein